MSNKKWIVSGIVVVAGVVLFFATRAGYGPGGTEGTIGAAQRYQSQQVSGADISLDNPQVAEFIQSDTFRKLATNDAFREAAKSESFNRFLAAEGLREASARQDMARVLESASVQELLKDEALSAALTDASMHEAAMRVDLGRLTEAGRLAELLKSEALRELAREADFQKFADEAARSEARSIAELGRLESYEAMKQSDAFKALEGNRHFAEAVKGGFLDLFRTPESAKFATEGLRTLAESNAFAEAARMEGFRDLARGITAENLGAVREVASRAEMLAVLSDASYREAAARAELGMIADAGMKEALARVSE